MRMSWFYPFVNNSFVFFFFSIMFSIFSYKFLFNSEYLLVLDILFGYCILSLILTLILSCYLFIKHIFKIKWYGLNLSDKANWFKTSSPMFIRDISYLSFDKGDIFILGFFVDPIIIGYYFTVQKIISTQDIILDSFLIKIRAAISYNISIGDYLKSHQIIKKTTIVNLLFAMIVGLTLYVLSEYLLILFSIESLIAIKIFKIIIIYQIIISSFNYISEPLIYADKQYQVVLIGFFFNLLNVILISIFMEHNNILIFIHIVYVMRICCRLFLLPIYFKTFNV